MDLQSLESLIDLLKQEWAIYDEMAVLLDGEREALLAMAAGRLGEIVARKDTLALRIKALDESRKLLARRLAASCGLRTDQVTVTKLSQLAPPEGARRLIRAGKALRQIVEQCQDLNQFNAMAAHRGMDVVGGVIQHLIFHADPAGKVYHAPSGGGAYQGVTSGSRAPGFISRRV
jgi:flagellar biosynthesis/type III secretory pathway chaperone